MNHTFEQQVRKILHSCPGYRGEIQVHAPVKLNRQTTLPRSNISDLYKQVNLSDNRVAPALFQAKLEIAGFLGVL
jgi:hypothetical protein